MKKLAMSLLMALSSAVGPQALAQIPPAQTPPAARHHQQHSNPRRLNKTKALTLKLTVRQRVP
jgi:hypothetical protein